MRSDNGPEYIAQNERDWTAATGANAAYIEPGCPRENGCCERVNARFRDELINDEIFYSLRDTQILIEQWSVHYNFVRRHSAPRYRPPVPQSSVPMNLRPVMHQQSNRTAQVGLIRTWDPVSHTVPPARSDPRKRDLQGKPLLGVRNSQDFSARRAFRRPRSSVCQARTKGRQTDRTSGCPPYAQHRAAPHLWFV